MRRLFKRMCTSSSFTGRNQNNSRTMDASSSSNISDGYTPSAFEVEQMFFMTDRSDGLLKRIGGLFSNSEMSDITLVVGGTEYPAHRLILCSSSEVFQVMLLNEQWNEAKANRVELQENDQCATVFSKFLEFFYTGQIFFTQDAVLHLLCLADKYDVKDLISVCVEYMEVHIACAAQHKLLVSWMQYTQASGHTQLAQACQNFIKWNFSLLETGDLEPDEFVSLLQQNDLVVQDEMQLYRCVVAWLDQQRERLEVEDREAAMSALIELVMIHVRFPMMSPRQLAELLLCPVVQGHMNFFSERLSLGMAFHSCQANSVREAMLQEGGRRLFTPRLYTADTWSAILTIDFFSLVQPYDSRTLVFSSPRSFADVQVQGERSQCEWVVDMYPRGVWHRKGQLILWRGTLDIPDAILRIVRLSVTCRDPEDDLHVKIGILVYRGSGDAEYVSSVTERNHHFDLENRVLNFNNLLPFEQIAKENYLVGPNKDTLKVHIIIAPICDLPAATRN